MLDEIRIEEAIVSSDLIITAEGSLDSQTLRGKAPYGVAQRAKKFNKPIVLLGGQVPSELSSDIQKNFDVVLSIMHGPSTIEKSLRFAATDMERTSFAVGNLIRLSRQL